MGETRFAVAFCIVAYATACGPGAASVAESTGDESTGGESTGDESTGDESTGDAPACQIAAAEGVLAWTIAGELAGSRRAVGVTPDAGAAIVGSQPSGIHDDAIVEVREVDGSVRWADAYAGAAGLGDAALDVAVDDEGFVHALVVETITLVEARDQATIDARLVVLRYAADGRRVWRWEREHVPAATFEQYTPDGSLAIVHGRIAMLELSWDEPIVRVELDRFGNVVSEVELANEVDTTVRVYDIADDGEVVLGGEIERNAQQQAWVARFGTDGAMIWSDAFGDRDDGGVAIATGPAGATMFAWATRTESERDVTLRRYGAQGEPEWTEPVALSVDSLALAVACDGSVLLISGVMREPLPDAPWDNRMALAIARHGSDGVPTWSIETEMPGPYTYGSGHAIAATRQGAAFVLGSYLDESGSTYAPWIGGVVQ